MTEKRSQHKDFKFEMIKNSIIKNRQREVALIEKKRKYNPDKDKQVTASLNEIETIRLQLKGIGKFISDDDISKMIKMQYSVKDMQQWANMRLLLSFVVFILGVIVSFFIHHVRGGMAVTMILTIGSWFLSSNLINSSYEKYQIERNVAFAEITRLYSAYAPELQYGSNLIALLNRIVPRIENEADRSAMQKLILDIQKDPTDSKPFLDFAHIFSTSDRAELIMLSMQQMYLGDVDDTSVRALADDANTDLLKQIDKVIEKKSDKFIFNNTAVVTLAMIVMFAYLLLVVIGQFSSIFSTLG